MPPKKVKRADGLYQVTATVGFDENGKRLRKVFYGKRRRLPRSATSILKESR